jgi:hypothetical protein
MVSTLAIAREHDDAMCYALRTGPGHKSALDYVTLLACSVQALKRSNTFKEFKEFKVSEAGVENTCFIPD